MMKTNFSQKRVEKNGKSAEKSFFLRRKPLLLVGQKGSNPRPSPKDPKHAVFSQKERNRGQKAPICGQAYPDLTEKQRRNPRRKRKKRAFQNFLFGFCQSVQLSQPADVVRCLEAMHGPGNPRISKPLRQVGGGEVNNHTMENKLKNLCYPFIQNRLCQFSSANAHREKWGSCGAFLPFRGAKMGQISKCQSTVAG